MTVGPQKDKNRAGWKLRIPLGTGFNKIPGENSGERAPGVRHATPREARAGRRDYLPSLEIFPVLDMSQVAEPSSPRLRLAQNQNVGSNGIELDEVSSRRFDERSFHNENPMWKNGDELGLERKRSNSGGQSGVLKDYRKPVDWRLDVLDFLDDPHSSRAAKIFNILMMFMIIMSITVFCVATAPRFKTREYIVFFEMCEWIFNVFFTTELLVRLVCGRKKLQPIHKHLAGIKCPMMLFDPFLWFDLASVLPFWLEKAVLFGAQKGVADRFDGTALSLLQASRMFRLFKLLRRYQVRLSNDHVFVE